MFVIHSVTDSPEFRSAAASSGCWRRGPRAPPFSDPAGHPAWTSVFPAPEEVGACVASPRASWGIRTVVPCQPQSLASPFLETVVNISRLWAIVLFCIFADVFLSGF